jgi:uncharacterized protein YndB with AHSA1/START domain
MTDNSRSIELEVEVPGTPEEVWAAVATGPGIGSWFVPSTVEEREGGELVHQFGPGDSMTVRGRVRVWEPPRRVVFDEGDAGEGGTGEDGTSEGGMAFEWLVEARDAGTCVVRLVNSGFGTGEDWDHQLDGMDAGWRMFLHNLQLHRRFFPGQVALAVQPMGMSAVTLDQAWQTLTEALGIPSTPSEGDHVTVGPDAPTALAGTVERSVPRMLTLRIREPGPGTALVAVEGTDGQAGISVWLWLYGAEAGDRAPALLQRWQEWLTDLFPMQS